MEQTAVEYLIKEFSNILGKIQTEPLQDLFLIDAINKSKKMEMQQIIDAYDVQWEPNVKNGKDYYNKKFIKRFKILSLEPINE